MRRLILLVALAFIIGGGSVLAAQTGTGSQTEDTNVGSQAVECATPGMGMEATPDAEEIEELLATAVASPDVVDLLATAIATPDASPTVLDDPCATPEMGTPAS